MAVYTDEESTDGWILVGGFTFDQDHTSTNDIVQYFTRAVEITKHVDKVVQKNSNGTVYCNYATSSDKTAWIELTPESSWHKSGEESLTSKVKKHFNL